METPEQILATAHETARVIVAAAERRLAAAKVAPVTVPDIVRFGYPAKFYDSNQWLLGFELDVVIKTLYYGSYVTNALNAKPYHCCVWLLVDKDGTYSPTSLRTCAPWKLPHVDTSGACLEVQDVPKTLVTRADYARFHVSLQRVLSGIQCDSLYTSYQNWPIPVRKFIPAALRVHFRGQNYSRLLTSHQELWTREEKTWKIEND